MEIPEIETPDPILENFTPEVVSINSSVEGQVQDLNKSPIQDATVRLGNLTTLTDEYGLFSFENVTMNEKGSLIRVTKDGQIDGSRRFFPREGMTSRVIIEMIPANIGSTFDAALGASITISTISGNTEVFFEPNSIADANGEIFEGEVFAIYTHLDPRAISTVDRMPGNLQGINSEIEEVALQSFGMVNIRLQDASGAPLNLLEGSTATIALFLPSNIVGSAPNEIPLWSFNEEFGIWVEEGMATKINDQYVGEVTHFSWWSCDAPFPLIELDLTLEDENVKPIADHGIGIGLGTNVNLTSYSNTNNEGFTSGKVPANVTLKLEIRGFCGVLIHSTTIGPFTEDTSLGTLLVENPNINNTQITGSTFDCNGNLITNGGINIEVGTQNYTTHIDDGNFDLFISTCEEPSNITVTGLDFDALLESDPVEAIAGTINNTRPIIVCDNPIPITESTLTFTIGDEPYEYFGDELEGVIWNFDLINIFYDKLSAQTTETNLSVLGNTVGNYDNNNECNMYDFTTDVPYSLIALTPNEPLNFENFNISQISPNIIGTFSGMAVNEIDTIPDTVFVSGSFNIFQ